MTSSKDDKNLGIPVPVNLQDILNHFIDTTSLPINYPETTTISTTGTSTGNIPNDYAKPVEVDNSFLYIDKPITFYEGTYNSKPNPVPKPNLGAISYQLDKSAICIYDGESWKTLISSDVLEKAFQEFRKKETDVVSKMTRFFELELDNEEQLPQAIQDELLTQVFRLKVQKLLELLTETKP